MFSLNSLLQGYAPENVEPSFDAPWMPLLSDGANWAVGTVLVVIVILLVVGVAIWVAGKLGGSGRAQEVGVTFLLWTVIGAIFVGAAGGIVAWASNLDWFG